MKQLLIQWPWATLKKGQGFFIPCLDTETMRTLGMRKAMEVRCFDAHYSIGIHNRRMGVWFFRKPSRTNRTPQSVTPPIYT